VADLTIKINSVPTIAIVRVPHRRVVASVLVQVLLSFVLGIAAVRQTVLGQPVI
jgi:hypothetical protein